MICFDHDPEEERRSRELQVCENCDQRAATLYCHADRANLCPECDVEVHAKGRLAARHQRVPLQSEAQRAISLCRSHPDKTVEFYCQTCSRPVCISCKMIGGHASGEAAKHRLITATEAYAATLEAAKARDPLMEQRKQTAQDRIAAIQERMQTVRQNAELVQNELEAAYRKAQQELQALQARKLNILHGDAKEFERQLEEIGRLESFLEYQRTSHRLDASQFILDFAQHQRLRNELHAFPYVRTEMDVQADLKLSGGLVVIGGLAPEVAMQNLNVNDCSRSVFEKRLGGGGHYMRTNTPSVLDLPLSSLAGKPRKSAEN